MDRYSGRDIRDQENTLSNKQKSLYESCNVSNMMIWPLFIV